MPAKGKSTDALNGFGVADWLVEPLLAEAADGMESLQRSEAPPRLIPLAGRRLRKLGKAEREAILAALGHHKRFTEVVLEMFRSRHSGEPDPYEQSSADEIIDRLQHGLDDAPGVVSMLLAGDRVDDALAVAAWAEEQPERDPMAEAMGALERNLLSRQQEAERLQGELAAERRATKRLERRLSGASQALEAKTKQATETAERIRVLEQDAAMVRARELELLARVAELEEAAESFRRERRDLRAELDDLQERYRRMRRQLKEARARLPEPEMPRKPPATPERTGREPIRSRPPGGHPSPADPAPALSELRDRFLEDGARGVLETKGIVVLVDGWNVSLGHAGGERPEDKRRRLEQALQGYQSRTGNRVIVVYDGRRVSWFWVPRAGAHTITRVFTAEGETADDYIVAEIEAGMPGVTPVVVTSDRELGRRCIAAGAFVISSEGLARLVGLWPSS